MTDTKSQAGLRFQGDTDVVLRLSAVVFVVALFVHGADHMRRGMEVVSTTITVAGTLQTLLALLTAGLVFRRSRWAPLAAIVVGFASAVGFTVVHLLPNWFGPLSDSFINAPPEARVMGFLWFAAIFEIVAGIAVGVAGLRAVRAPHAVL
jgi:hypothetical protein